MTRRSIQCLGAAALVAATLASVSLAAPAEAHAQDINTPFRGQRPFQLDFHGGFTWWGYGAAAGARFGIPILHNGFIDSINNAVYLNFGGDFYFIRYRPCNGGGCDWEYHPGFGIPVALHWEFYFNQTWSAFAELGVNVFFHPGFFRGNRDFFEHDYVGSWFLAAVGGRLHFNESIALTLRVSTNYVSFGVTFMF